MSCIPLQTNVTGGNVLFTPKGQIATLASSFTIVPLGAGTIGNNTIDNSIYTLSNVLYPNVGSIYSITLSFTGDYNFTAVPNGIINSGLAYAVPGGANIVVAKEGQYIAGSATNTDLYGNLTLTFKHTNSSNLVYFQITNLAGQPIDRTTSALLIQNLSVIEYPQSSTTIPPTVFY